MVTRPDYDAEQVAAARSVLIELTRILGEYREHIVLVGGWIPELLLPTAEPKHVGSLDIDAKEKDAYDIYFCVKHFPGGVGALAEAFRPHIDHGLVKEGLAKIAGKFGTPRAFGPMAVADFEQVTDAEERNLLTRDAYEQVKALLDALGIGGAKA